MTLTNIKNSPLKNTKILTITSGFGSRSFYNPITKKNVKDFHNGIDLIGGTIIVTPAKGKVISVRDNITGYNEKYSEGNYVIIDHGNGISTAYYHIKYGTVKVKEGDIVEIGSELGIMGATGYVTGPHLHFGVRINGKWIDPIDYLLGNKNLVEDDVIIKDDTLYYIINHGDTLTGIAQKYNTSIQELVKLNNIKDPNLIIAGAALKIPTSQPPKKEKIYTVVPGDNLSSIAQNNGTTWQRLYELNKNLIGNNPNYILPGWKLKIE